MKPAVSSKPSHLRSQTPWLHLKLLVIIWVNYHKSTSWSFTVLGWLRYPITLQYDKKRTGSAANPLTFDNVLIDDGQFMRQGSWSRNYNYRRDPFSPMESPINLPWGRWGGTKTSSLLPSTRLKNRIVKLDHFPKEGWTLEIFQTTT